MKVMDRNSICSTYGIICGRYLPIIWEKAQMGKVKVVFLMWFGLKVMSRHRVECH